MKKTIFILISILAAVFIVLSIFGIGGEYGSEKLFYRAMKTNSKIVMNPDVAPPALLAEVENNLKLLVSKYPNADITKTGYIALAEFYVAHKEYDKAIALTDTIMSTYKDHPVIMSTAQFMKGVIYEKQNNWPGALAEFIKLRNEYSHTQLGMQIPIYIAKYYDMKGNESEARKAYEDAQSFYGNMAKEYSGKNLGYIASTMLAQVFLSSREYEKAGEELESIFNEYSSDMSFAQLIPLAEIVFTEKLKEPKRLAVIYKNIKEKSHDKKLKQFLQKRIDSIESKSSNVNI